jgi:hypothetical protein
LLVASIEHTSLFREETLLGVTEKAADPKAARVTLQ